MAELDEELYLSITGEIPEFDMYGKVLKVFTRAAEELREIGCTGISIHSFKAQEIEGEEVRED